MKGISDLTFKDGFRYISVGAAGDVELGGRSQIVKLYRDGPGNAFANVIMLPGALFRAPPGTQLP